MPIAYIQEFPADGDTSTTNYDAVKAKLNVEGDRPDGMIIHTAGFTEEGVSGSSMSGIRRNSTRVS